MGKPLPLKVVDDGAMYVSEAKVYPREVSGRFQRFRHLAVVVLLGLYYGVAWIDIGGQQAVLWDLPARKFHVFGLVFWPQDFIFLALLLVMAGLSLFFFTALAGRLWCGYACPQTVWTEVFLWMERWTEGDRAKRMKLDAGPWTGGKLLRKGSKHLLWAAFALWTGFTFVGYFTPIRELGARLVPFEWGGYETFWTLFYAVATWGNAGFLREQVCKYMCPYARFQSAMFDPDTLIVTYDTKRGEPRGSRGKSADPRASGLGDCVDCGICVQVCPTGIDIRNGLQYECIGCGACVDGCNQVMAKMGYPKGLIRYSTENAVAGRYDDRDILRHLLRPRTLLYSGLLLAVTVAVVAGIVLRTPVKMNIIRDRGNIVRELEDGRLENVYRVQIMNTREDARSFVLSVRGIDGVELVVRETQPIRVGSAGARIVPLELRVPAGSVKAGSTPVWLKVEATDDAGVAREEKTVFISR
ncbi:MAG: cytochrome c oxidase accessory protein CcoG [bacterium]